MTTVPQIWSGEDIRDPSNQETLLLTTNGFLAEGMGLRIAGLYKLGMLREPAKTLEECIDNHRELQKKRPGRSRNPRLLSISIDDIQERYNHYMRKVEEQRHILSTKEDFTLLGETISKLINLQSVELSTKFWFEERSVRQTEALLQRLTCSGIKLHSFVVSGLDVFHVEPTFFDQIILACNCLTSIDLQFDTCKVLEPKEGAIIRAINKTPANTGILAAFLQSFPSLVRLSVGTTYTGPDKPGLTSLSHVVSPSFKWQFLRHFGLKGIQIERHELLNFFKLHQATLKSISMDNCALGSTSWTRLFRQMKGLLKLEDICISGNTCGWVEAESDYAEPVVVGESRENWSLGYPEAEKESFLTTQLSAWFLNDKTPYPLKHHRMFFMSSHAECDSVDW
ncbi:hypothetical protein F5B20DRAFT_596801 [Whalleya microplaca]|nr:hypothetical protein F5B20DRAFT_596801 [Whalleya microplaca]